LEPAFNFRWIYPAAGRWRREVNLSTFAFKSPERIEHSKMLNGRTYNVYSFAAPEPWP
jgi:hypothetical protein